MSAVLTSTEAARALTLANSYFDEVVNTIPNPLMIEPESVSEIITSLDLAETQLDKAERLNPAVTVTHEIEAGVVELDIRTTRSAVLLYRGLAIGFGRGEKVAGAYHIEQAIALAPSGIANAHAALSILYVDSGRKSDGIKQLHKAIELDPDNLELQKMLGRLEFESEPTFGSEPKLQIATFHGSWKIFIVFCALGLFGLMVKNFFMFFFFGGIAAGYWWFKSRRFNF